MIWAVYLACSWTWCIGMFLPTLLMRDFGLASFLAFAAPNVIGAAAMGWVVASRDLGQQMVATHGVAMRAFSLATIAFQAFFAFYLGRLVEGEPSAVLIAAIIVTPLVLAWIPRARPDLWLGVAVVAVSLVSLIVYVQSGPVTATWAALPSGAFDPLHLIPLAPVCAFGFLLCPYLDLTFHRARQSLGRDDARVAFGIGFGVFFAAMIGFSLLYGPALVRGRLGPEAAGAAWAAWLVVHIAAQLGFTILVHVRELLAARGGARRPGLPLVAGAVLVALGLGILAEAPSDLLPTLPQGMHELIYRSFMGLYGLAFPAYVWVCMIPRRGTPRGPTPRKLAVLAGAVALASPMYWAGFVMRDTWWLVPGLAIVLASRLLIAGGRRVGVTASAPRDGAGSTTPPI